MTRMLSTTLALLVTLTLVGAKAGEGAYAAAAKAALQGAKAQKHNAFKIELAKRAVVRALTNAAGRER